MESTEIKKCRVCLSDKLSSIINLGKLHLSDFTSGTNKPPKHPLSLVLCSKCFLVQLKHNAPASDLYNERYGYRSGINNTMKEELKDIVKKSVLHLNKRGKLIVVDIGANDGTLLSNYPKSYFRIAVDPVKKFAIDSKKFANEVITDFFNKETVKKALGARKADIVTAISCFYDMEDPNGFVEDVKQILNKNGIFVIQQNYLLKMLLQNAFDNIVHEHLEYYSLTSLQNLLNKHDLEVFDVEQRELNGGSFRTYICKKGQRAISNSVYETLELERLINLNRKDIYRDFARKLNSIKNELQSFVSEQTKLGKSIYLYGASTRGNTLLQYFKLDNKVITKAVERNPEKWGKIISSVGIPIISEEQARKEKPDFMLVLPWFFKDEFLKRENSYLKSGGHFIFPLPKLEVV